MKYLKALATFVREFQDITDHARTGRRPTPRKPQTGTEAR